MIDNNLILKDLNYFEIAANLGSDIPFFIYNYDYGLVSGIGELVEKVNLKTKIKINIYYPNIKVSTKEIFNHFSQSKKSQNLNNFNKIINDINNNIIEDEILNDL